MDQSVAICIFRNKDGAYQAIFVRQDHSSADLGMVRKCPQGVADNGFDFFCVPFAKLLRNSSEIVDTDGNVQFLRHSAGDGGQ